MGRYWELDAGRGVAILLMIGYHVLFQLSFFAPGFVPWFNPYVLTGAPIAFLFVVIVGVFPWFFLRRGREVCCRLRGRCLSAAGIFCVLRR